MLMETIALKRDLAKDLVETKLRIIKEEIAKILEKWNQDSTKELITLTRAGEIPEAELDAIALTNLVKKRDELDVLLREIGG